jgi:hypothetical protein
MTEYRASFDAAIRFSNGGDLTAHGFRVDVPSPDVDEAAIAALFVASLGLLMTDSPNRTRERAAGLRTTVVASRPRAAGWSNSAT